MRNYYLIMSTPYPCRKLYMLTYVWNPCSDLTTCQLCLLCNQFFWHCSSFLVTQCFLIQVEFNSEDYSENLWLVNIRTLPLIVEMYMNLYAQPVVLTYKFLFIYLFFTVYGITYFLIEVNSFRNYKNSVKDGS